MKKIVIGFVCVLLVLFCGQKIRGYLAERYAVEKYNRFISETQECLDSREWKCAERNVRHLLEKNAKRYQSAASSFRDSF